MNDGKSQGSGGPGGAPLERIDKYEVVRELGRGGQAVVYLASDPDLGRHVAVKVLTGWGPASESALARFRREAEVASKLDHPGICTVYDAGVADGFAYIVMQYVEGDSLRQRLTHASQIEGDFHETTDLEGDPDDVTLEPESEVSSSWSEAELQELLRVFERTARALHAAHQANVIHRDLKPGNIIVDRKNRPVIVDFGLARDTERHHSSITQTGDLFGTPAYMSPEQLAGQHIPLDGRTDVYSLGVTLYEVLTLRRPFQAPSRQALYQAIMTKDPRDPRELNPRVSKDLRTVVETALEKDRDRRYQSALDFAEDLERARVGEPVEAKAAGPIVKLRRWVHRNPVLAPMVLGLFVVLAIGLTTSLILLESARAERDAKVAALRDVRRLSDVQRLHELAAWDDTLWPPVAEKVDGRTGMTAWLATATELRAHLPEYESALAEMQDEVAPDEFARWTRAELEDLVAGVRGLDAPFRRMEKRREWALTGRARTLTDHRDAWKRFKTEVEQAHGLRLDEMPGLVPLGKDPVSGLQELAVAYTGTVPVRGDDGVLRIDQHTAIILVLLPRGTAKVGTGDPAAHPVEAPRHEIALGPFLIGKYEVTQAQWRRLRGANPAYYAAGRSVGATTVTLAHPVEQVSYEDAAATLARVGLGLPTEAQWEYAARAGTTHRWSCGDDVASLQGHANLADRDTEDTYLAGGSAKSALVDDWPGSHAPIGRFKPNAFGLHDVHGNVWEWCRDRWARGYANPARPGDGLRQLPADEPRRVARGGGFFSPASKARSAARVPLVPTFRNRGLGVRAVRTLDG